MIPQLGPLEILVVVVVALLVFGPNRLPEVARQVGRGIREVKKVQEQLSTELHDVLHADEDATDAHDPGATLAAPIRIAEPDTTGPGTGTTAMPGDPVRRPEPGRAPSRFRPPTGP